MMAYRSADGLSIHEPTLNNSRAFISSFCCLVVVSDSGRQAIICAILS